jgi:DNA-binding LacI/PurR family transcriptional regulator
MRACIRRGHCICVVETLNGGDPAWNSQERSPRAAQQRKSAVGNLLRGVSTIATDSPAIANMAADHLVGQGLRSFAFCGIQNCPWSLKREQAFCGRIGEIGFPCERHRINVGDWPRQGDWTREWPAEQSRLSLWLKSLPRQSGLIACNDMCGRHVLEACREARVRVPDHIAVVGVGNDDLACELSHPPLSSVALDVEKAGYEAAHLLDALMSGAIKNGVHVVPVSPLWTHCASSRITPSAASVSRTSSARWGSRDGPWNEDSFAPPADQS